MLVSNSGLLFIFELIDNAFLIKTGPLRGLPKHCCCTKYKSIDSSKSVFATQVSQQNLGMSPSVTAIFKKNSLILSFFFMMFINVHGNSKISESLLLLSAFLICRRILIFIGRSNGL